jgi:phosphoribosylformylglycinamidine (FGAM) synthase-like amidotransferase family enzyme
MSERELAIALDTDFSEDDADYESEDSFILSVKDEVGSDDLHKLFLQAVDECESMWCCNSNGTSIKLKNSTVLVCGGTSWGDEPDGFVEIQRFEKCGAAKAAGFWV